MLNFWLALYRSDEENVCLGYLPCDLRSKAYAHASGKEGLLPHTKKQPPAHFFFFEREFPH